MLQVLDMHGYYLMATETLNCTSCNYKVAAWMPSVLRQLSEVERSYLPAVLTKRLVFKTIL